MWAVTLEVQREVLAIRVGHDMEPRQVLASPASHTQVLLHFELVPLSETGYMGRQWAPAHVKVIPFPPPFQGGEERNAWKQARAYDSKGPNKERKKTENGNILAIFH